MGATPVLVDSDLGTFNTTPELMKPLITKKTKAIMPVDVAGMPIDVDAFTKFAQAHNLIIIEDAAQGLGAVYKGKKIGSFNHTAIYSFHMAKLATTVEGGCIVTNDEKIAHTCAMIRNHGMEGRCEYKVFGLNLRINDIQSAIGRVQLRKIEKYIALRNKLVNMYKKGLGDIAEFQNIPPYVSTHPHMLFGILVDAAKRDAIIKTLNENGIGTRICWNPAHRQPYHSAIFKGNYPNADKLSSRIINVPMGNDLSEEDVQYVIDIFRKAVKESQDKISR